MCTRVSCAWLFLGKVLSLLGGTAFAAGSSKSSFHFQAIETRTALQMIADFADVNMVVSDSVQGHVTLCLKEVTWEEALAALLKAKGLSEQRVGKIFWIGTAEEMAWHEKREQEQKWPLRTAYFQIYYASASDLVKLLKNEKQMFLSTRGMVSCDPRTNRLVLQDIEPKLSQMRDFLQQVDVPMKQIVIEARVVYTHEALEDLLGLRFHAKKEWHAGSALAIGSSEGGSLSRKGDRIFPLETAPLEAPIHVTLARLPIGTLLDLELMALEQEGLGKIVASPRLVASDKQKAFIEAGEEIPYQKATASGATSVGFKKAVLRLEVIPQVTSDNQVLLDLKVNQDARGLATGGVPAVNTRQLQTTVLAQDGETIVLGGIYQEQWDETRVRLPFLGRLPLIGKMFTHKTRAKRRNELLIFVTPKMSQGKKDLWLCPERGSLTMGD